MLTHHINPTDAIRVYFPAGEVLQLNVAELPEMIRRHERLMKLAEQLADRDCWFGLAQKEARAILAEVEELTTKLRKEGAA